MNYLTLQKFQLSQFLSDLEPSEIYISLSFLYKLQTLEAYISCNIDIFYICVRMGLQVRLTFGEMYPQDEALGQVDIRSDFGLVRNTFPQDEALGQVDIWSDVPPG